MKHDIFLSICQTDVDGFMPNEKQMFSNFFDQVKLADDLGFGTAWIAETHLSCEVQKQTENPVIPFFKGEIGLNTDILQMAHVVFSQTKNINVGSAIRNILCNGGPIAHAEEMQTALSLMEHTTPDRQLEIGFASGRFEFSNRPYGIRPRTELEELAWPAVKGKVLTQATEIFLRMLNGEEISSSDVATSTLDKADFRSDEDWMKAGSPEGVEVPCFWNFEKSGVIPREADQSRLNLTLGSHDPNLQIMANKYRPVRVFNLSITPQKVIDETHARMKEHYHKSGGEWQRHYMPRTAMIFLNEDSKKAKAQAEAAWTNYWKAMEGTIDTKKVEMAVKNTLAGSPEELKDLIAEKYHPDDRLMLWFDFNNHDNEEIKKSMKLYMEKVAQ